MLFVLIVQTDIQQLIVDKAMEDLKKEEQEKAQEKKRILEERVPPLDLDNLSQGDIQLISACASILTNRNQHVITLRSPKSYYEKVIQLCLSSTNSSEMYLIRKLHIKPTDCCIHN